MDGQASTAKPANVPEIKPGTNASFGPLKHVNAGVLSIAYAEAGPADGPPVLLFHGWPYDIHSYIESFLYSRRPATAFSSRTCTATAKRGFSPPRRPVMLSRLQSQSMPSASWTDSRSIKRLWGDLTGVAETPTFWHFFGPSASRRWSR